MKYLLVVMVSLIFLGSENMATSGAKIATPTSVVFEQKLQFILNHIQPPQEIFTLTAERWTEYENEYKTVFPEEYREILNLFGCGVFSRSFVANSTHLNKRIILMHPDCDTGARTWHESLLLDWEQDMEERKYDSNWKMPYLFPEPNGVYTWGYYGSGTNLSFPYKTNEAGWKIVDGSVTVEHSGGWFAETVGFIDLIYQFVEEAVNPKDGTVTTKFEFVPAI
jgi:hypothetical protein